MGASYQSWESFLPKLDRQYWTGCPPPSGTSEGMVLPLDVRLTHRRGRGSGAELCQQGVGEGGGGQHGGLHLEGRGPHCVCRWEK